MERRRENAKKTNSEHVDSQLYADYIAVIAKNEHHLQWSLDQLAEHSLHRKRFQHGWRRLGAVGSVLGGRATAYHSQGQGWRLMGPMALARMVLPRASTWAKIAFGAAAADAARTLRTLPTIICFFFIKSQLGPVNTVTLYVTGKVTTLHNNLLEGEILTGERIGEHFCLPKINLEHSDPAMPFRLTRRQLAIPCAPWVRYDHQKVPRADVREGR